MKQAADTKDLKVMVCEMVAENFIIKMEDFTKVPGRIIRWTAMADSTMKEVNSLMKDTGFKMNSMAWVRSTTIILWSLGLRSTTQTLSFWRTTGSTMRAC